MCQLHAKNDARVWWDHTKNAKKGAIITYNEFVELFYEEYLSKDHIAQKIDDLSKLEQGELLVREYGRKFSALTCFVPTLMPNEKVHVQWFIRGLSQLFK